jgi:hypothetical protein
MPQCCTLNIQPAALLDMHRDFKFGNTVTYSCFSQTHRPDWTCANVLSANALCPFRHATCAHHTNSLRQHCHMHQMLTLDQAAAA